MLVPTNCYLELHSLQSSDEENKLFIIYYRKINKLTTIRARTPKRYGECLAKRICPITGGRERAKPKYLYKMFFITLACSFCN